jgi:hypothetical protein
MIIPDYCLVHSSIIFPGRLWQQLIVGFPTGCRMPHEWLLCFTSVLLMLAHLLSGRRCVPHPSMGDANFAIMKWENLERVIECDFSGIK